MAGVLKTARLGCVTGLVFHAAGISALVIFFATLGLVAAGFGMWLEPRAHKTLWWLLSSSTMRYLLIALAIFIPSMLFLARFQARTRALIARINAQHGLSFNDQHILADYSPQFMVFDRQHRKLAVCSRVDDTGQVHDFSWLLRWGATWGTVEYVERSGDNSHVRERAVNFAIDLRTADPECPLLSFPMNDHQAANLWSARNNAIING